MWNSRTCLPQTFVLDMHECNPIKILRKMASRGTIPYNLRVHLCPAALSAARHNTHHTNLPVQRPQQNTHLKVSVTTPTKHKHISLIIALTSLQPSRIFCFNFIHRFMYFPLSSLLIHSTLPPQLFSCHRQL